MEGKRMNNNNHHHHGHHHHGHHEQGSTEVLTNVTYTDGKLRIEIKDDKGNAPRLSISHEKEIHVIVVSNDLTVYKHIHPEKQRDGVFIAYENLEPGLLQVFVDISPEDKHYTIKPNAVYVDEVATEKANLIHETHWEKEIKGKKVQLEKSDMVVDKAIDLTFHLKNDNPEPYLGALGHVVIIDEAVKEFIHVHPISEKTTKFEAHFSKAGMYKLWAEFKFSDVGVIAFPFVLDIKEPQ